MAVIRSESILFGGMRFLRKIKCNSKGRFIIDLPSEVRGALGKSSVEGSSLQDVLDKFDEMRNKYVDIETKTRKVIFFDVGMLFRSLDPPIDIMMFTECCSGAGMGNGFDLSIQAAILEEKELTVGDVTDYNYNVISSSIPKEMYRAESAPTPGRGKRLKNIIEHTPEREAAVTQICKGFIDLLLKLNKFVSDKDAFVNMLDTPSLHLLTAPKKEDAEIVIKKKRKRRKRKEK